MSYWAEARSWAKSNTKTFTPHKAIPSVLATIVQWGVFDLQPMTRALVTVGTLVGSYVLLYALEFIWRLLIEAPAAIHASGQLELANLYDKVSALEQPSRAPADAAKIRQIQSIFIGCGDEVAARRFLSLLVKRPEYEYGEFRLAIGKIGLTPNQFSSVLEASEQGHLVLRIKPTPMRQYNYLQVNPEYKSLLLEVLHSQ